MADRSSPYLIDFPTLFVAADWVSAHCVVPDGFDKGDPFELVDWQLWALLNFYRVKPGARVGQLAPAFFYRRSQIVLPQKAGKAPYSAAHVCVEGVGPAVFAGWAEGGERWDCRDHGCGCGWMYEYRPGEAMATCWPTPLIQITATSEEQPLALDTRVPTPAGWSTVGDLDVGDEVFDDLGRPTRVTRRTPVLFGEPCYAVEFSDGERIVASAEHKWTVDRKTPHGSTRIRETLSTRQLAASKQQCRVESGAFELPTVPLAVDPYLLGLWLGDGATADATIAMDARHREELEAIITPLLQPHEVVVWACQRGHQGTLRIRKRDKLCPWGHDWSEDQLPWGTGVTCGQCMRDLKMRKGRSRTTGVPLLTFRQRLRAIGVLGDKHIPPMYLRAGTEQRRALLQGLIDSDGHVEPNGRAGFTNVNERLARDVGALLTTLGYPWRIRHDRFAWRVQFTPGDGRPVARLAYKANAQRPWHSRSRRARYRYIVSVEAVSSVPVRCIGVNATDHLFLVGDRAVPTHNTDNIYDALRPMIDQGPLSELVPKTGEEFIRLPNDGRIDVVTSNARSRLGQRVTFCPQDETGIWMDTGGMIKVAETQRRGLAGMGGRAEETTNAWDPSEHSVAQRTAESRRPDIFRLHPDPPASLSYTNKAERRKIHRLVYRGCHWIDQDAIEAEAQELLEEDPVQAERFFGNRAVAGGGKAFDAELFASLAVADGIGPGRKATLGFDGAFFFDGTGLVATDIETGRQVVVGYWERPLHLADDDDWEVPIEEVNEAQAFAFDFWDIWREYGDPPHYREDLSRWAGEYGDKRVIEWWTNANKQMGYALREYRTAMRSGSLSHGPLNDSPEAEWAHAQFIAHIGNAVKRPTKIRVEEQSDDGETKQTAQFLWTIRKESQKSRKRIDLAMAGCLSWRARIDAVRSGVLNEQTKSFARAAWQ